MLSNFLIFCILCSGSVLGAVCFRRRFEEIIPITCILIVLILFLFGLAGQLLYGVYAVIIAAACVYLFSICVLVKEGREKGKGCAFISSLMHYFVTPGFVVYGVYWCFFQLGDFNLRAIAWDEFTHWMYAVKTMTHLDDFGTNPLAYSGFPSYPPGMTLFQYFFQKVYLMLNQGVAFSEWRAYLAYQLLTVALAMPLMKRLSFKKPLEMVVAAMIPVIIHLPFYYYEYECNYASVMVDPVIGITTGYCFSLILLNKEKDNLYAAYIALYCALLVLVKDVGLYFACFAAGAFFLKELSYYAVERNSIGTLQKAKYLLGSGMPLFSALLVKVLWRSEVNSSGCIIRFNEKIDFLRYTEMFFLNNDDTFRQTCVNRFKEAFFNREIFFGVVSLSYFTTFFIFAYIIYLVGRKLINDGYPKRAVVVTNVTLLVSLIVYIYSLGATYIFNFSEYEALNLASYERYLNIGYLAVWTVILMTVWSFISKKESVVDSRPLLLGMLVFLFAITPMNAVTQFAGRTEFLKSYVIRNAYEPLSQLIKDHCSPEDRIYLISQGETAFENLVVGMNTYPLNVDSSLGTKFGKEQSGEDVPDSHAASYVPIEEWRELLFADYQYVAIQKVNDVFIEMYGSLFEDPTQITQDSLYLVDRESGLLKKCVE